MMIRGAVGSLIVSWLVGLVWIDFVGWWVGRLVGWLVGWWVGRLVVQTCNFRLPRISFFFYVNFVLSFLGESDDVYLFLKMKLGTRSRITDVKLSSRITDAQN